MVEASNNRFKARLFHQDDKGSYLVYGYFLGTTPNGNIRFAAVGIDSLGNEGEPVQLIPIEYPPTAILEQCTGLQDCHNDWIFEGDLVISDCGEKDVTVEWSNGSWGMEKPWRREIVGNIHEGRSGFRSDMQTNGRMKEW